jgi:eukaryotic-like serine/threonine-protein kinase
MGVPSLPSTHLRRLRGGIRRLGRYELIGQLAKGGMGTVFLARHGDKAGFQRLFAVKVLHEHLVDEPGFVDMLQDEGRLAARIHHPNVVGVVDLGRQDDYHYIVMDYVEGPTFATLTRRNIGPIPLAQCIAIVLDALEGLHAAHTLTDDEGAPIRLVHRDVSPQNILVGVDGLAKITDFGIAKAESRIVSTQPGTRKGKLHFMSPEQFKSLDKIDQRTDIWAIGVLLWNVLTGETLFHGESQAAIIHRLLSLEIPPPSKVSSSCPAYLDPVILKALERDPENRYDTALEMAEALRSIAANNGIVGSRHSVAAWVNEAFKDELQERRAAIRDAASRSDSIPPDTSSVTSLPSLPAMGATPSGLSLDEGTPHDDDLTDSIPPSSPPGETANGPSVRSPRRALAIGTALALMVGAAGAFALWSRSDGPPASDVAHPQPQATVQGAAVEEGRPETASPSTMDPEPSTAGAEVRAEAEGREDTSRKAEANPGGDPEANGPQPPGSATGSGTAPAPRPRSLPRSGARLESRPSTPKTDAPKTSTPRPAPGSGTGPGELERNPYVRH